MYWVRRGDGYPVLFLHGIPTSCRLWDFVIERLLGQFTCIAVDLPGLGKSSAMPHSFRDLSGLASTLDQIRIDAGIEIWHIVGHDAGCAIAIQYANLYPGNVGCLALLSASIFPDLRTFLLFEFLRTRVVGEVLAPLVSFLFWRVAMRMALGSGVEVSACRRDFHAPFTGFRGAWRMIKVLRWGEPQEILASIPSMLPFLTAPALIFHGSADPAVPPAFAARASALIPRSEVVMIDTGHFLPLNQPELIASHLLRFFHHHQDARELVVTETRAVAV